MQILSLGSAVGPGLGWDTHLETWICSGGTRMELRSNSLDLDTQVRQDMNGSKTHIMIPGWVSDWTWMDTRCSFRDPHEGETWPGWRWDAYIETCIEMSCNLDGCETLILRQVSIISTHHHPGNKSLLSKFQNSISVPPSTHINAIQVLSHIHLGSCFNSIHVSSDFHHGP